MNSVNPLGQYQSATAAQQQAVAKGDELGQEAFMRLMVAQLENQDPSKPMDNFEFLSQIAQFGTVDGIQGLQDSMAGLVTSLTANQGLQASNLIGREVLSSYGTGVLPASEGGSLNGKVELPVSAGGLRVSIQDEAGNLVRTIELGPQSAGNIAFGWDGINNAGGQAVPGTYQVTAEALIDGQMLAVPAFTATRVESVSLTGGGAQATLNVTGGGTLPLSDVREFL